MEKIKRENENTLTFDIYKTKNGLYVNSDVCFEYNIGDSNDNKTILNRLCHKVTKDEIKNITEQNPEIKPRYKNIYENKMLLSFTIFVDISHNRDLYISNSLCIKYNIEPKNQHYINGSLYSQVTNQDIQNIDKIVETDKISVRKKYVLIQLSKENTEETKRTFTYYYDQRDKLLYIQREIYENAKDLNINIEGKPKIINNNNCYSITEDQLKEIESSLQKKGVQRIINPNNKIKKNNQIDKKGELSMNNQESNIDTIKEELNRISEQEKEIQALLEENRRKMETVKENMKRIIEHQNHTPALQPVTLDNINTEPNEDPEGRNVVVLLGNNDIDINQIQDSIKAIIEKTAKEYTERELKDVKIDVERLKEELREYLNQEDRYVIKILGDNNIDINDIQSKVRQIIKNNAEDRLINQLNQLKINIDSIKHTLNTRTNNDVNAHLVLLLGNPNEYNITDIKNELHKYIDESTQKNFVKILGDQNVNIEEIRNQLNKYINEQKEQNIVKILGDQNVNIEEIKRQLNKHLEETADKNIVKILGDQNTDIDRVKRELDRILNAEKDQNLVKILGNPNVDLNEIERKLNKYIEKETNDNIIKNVSAYNIDLNAVREELLNKKRLEPTERRIAQSVGDDINADSIEKDLANNLYDDKNENIVKLLGNQNVDINEIKRKVDHIAASQNYDNVLVYKEINTNKLYAPAKYVPNAEIKVINGKEYAEANQEIINNIKDALVVYKDITLEPTVVDIIICNANEKLFISQDVLNSLGMYVVDPHKIIVNKEIYVEITKDDLDVVRSKESDALHLNITIKHITPIKG